MSIRVYIVHTSPSSCFQALDSSSHMCQCRLNFFTCRHYRPGPSSTRKDTFGRPVARFDVNYFYISILQGCYNDGVFKRLLFSRTLLQHFASINLLDQNFHIINYTIRLLWQIAAKTQKHIWGGTQYFGSTSYINKYFLNQCPTSKYIWPQLHVTRRHQSAAAGLQSLRPGEEKER